MTKSTAIPSAPWRPRLPAHLKQRVPSGGEFFRVRQAIGESSLTTVCEEALCPNRTDCWARGTLTFQILGSICTRRCSFCAETTGRPGAPDPREAAKLAALAARLRLRHVVITSPARDDLPDQGAGAFAGCIRRLRRDAPGATVEVLIPDFQGRDDLVDKVIDAQPDVFNHNMETVRRLTPRVRARATYDRSLAVLRRAARAGLRVKSGLMVGLGETRAELLQAFHDVRETGAALFTLGQYLPPSPDHHPVARYYTPAEFADLRRAASALFPQAMVGPLVRSSYHADELAEAV